MREQILISEDVVRVIADSVLVRDENTWAFLTPAITAPNALDLDSLSGVPKKALCAVESKEAKARGPSLCWLISVRSFCCNVDIIILN